MTNGLADLYQKNETKKKIIQYGGTHEMNKDIQEYFVEWLVFLTNPVNLLPALPDLTLRIDSRQLDYSSISISFNQQKASIRSMKFELIDWHEGSTEIFLDEPDQKKNINLIDGKPKDICTTKKWVFNLFLHSGLEELELPAIPELQELLNKHPTVKINWTPFTPATNSKY